MCGTTYGKIHLADLDYADNVAMLAEIIENGPSSIGCYGCEDKSSWVDD